MDTETKELAGTLLLLLAFVGGGFLVVDTADINASAEQGNGCVFWSHTDNRAFWTGIETVTTEGITCPDGSVTRIA